MAWSVSHTRVALGDLPDADAYKELLDDNVACVVYGKAGEYVARLRGRALTETVRPLR